MGTVARQEKMGEVTTTLSFESYEDFLDYQKKEREQDALDVAEAADKRFDFVANFFKTPDELPGNKYQIVLTEEEYYFLCILVGHLFPNNGITRSLLDKFSLDLEANDYDRLQFSVNVVNNQADVQMKLNEFNLENK